MLVYGVIRRCKFILHLKSEFWKNNRSNLVLITLYLPAHASVKI